MKFILEIEWLGGVKPDDFCRMLGTLLRVWASERCGTVPRPGQYGLPPNVKIYVSNQIGTTPVNDGQAVAGRNENDGHALPDFEI